MGLRSHLIDRCQKYSILEVFQISVNTYEFKDSLVVSLEVFLRDEFANVAIDIGFNCVVGSVDIDGEFANQSRLISSSVPFAYLK